MTENKNIKNEWLHLRLSKAEYDQIHKAFSATTEKKLSKYARNILLGKPMIAGYRNLTSEALIKELSLLIKTLNGIANNYNQAVHKLHTLDHYPDIKRWLDIHEASGKIQAEHIASIKEYLKNFAEKWLQS